MKKKNKADLTAKIKEVKQLIVSSNDAKYRGELVEMLLKLQKDVLHEPIELEVLCKDVTKTIDFGANKLLKTKRGYLFVAKGGLSTFVESKMAGVCGMFEMVFDLNEKFEAGQVEAKLYGSIVDAVQYVMQTPIFASMNSQTLFETATNILNTFTKYCGDDYTNAEVQEETEEDIKANNEMEQVTESLEELLDSPIPPVSE